MYKSEKVRNKFFLNKNELNCEMYISVIYNFNDNMFPYRPGQASVHNIHYT